MNASHLVPRISVQSIAQLAKGASWRLGLLHVHDADLLLWVTKGQGLSIVQGVRRGVGIHNALFIPAGHLFSLDLGKQGFGLAIQLPARSGLGMPDEAQHLRVRDVHAQSEITAILEDMQREQAGNRPFADECVMADAMRLSVWLRRQMIELDDAQERSSGSAAAQRLSQAFCALVARDFHTGKSMADYATDLGVTPTHLARSCRDACGMTASEILTQCTLHAARDLIETSDHPLQNIGQALGFGSAAYFSRFVQHQTGHPPSALRRGART